MEELVCLYELLFLFYRTDAAPGLSLVSGWASSGGEPWITHFEFSTVGPLLRSWRQVILGLGLPLGID